MSYGIPLHPSETAGDGLPIDQSFYLKKADKPDNYVYCSMCGWPVNLNKRPQGDSYGAIPPPVLGSDTVNPPAPGVSFTEKFGTPVPGAGCDFCGTLNPKGFKLGEWENNVRDVSGL